MVDPILGAKLLVFSFQGTNKATLAGGAARDPKILITWGTKSIFCFGTAKGLAPFTYTVKL